MNYDFDKIIDRKGTNSLKYDFAVQRKRPENVLPLWVADMDFQAPNEVIEKLVERSRHGIFGYSDSDDKYFNAVSGWYKKQFGYEFEKKWLVKTPGIVFAIATAIKAFTNEGDSVLIQQPVYYPFSECILKNNRKLINSPLVYKENKYSIDFMDFENKIEENNVKLFILCSPHNPVGRVWTREELLKMGEICIKHNVLVISDEIHSDFVWKGKHTIFSSLGEKFADNSIICTAPSKTFNLAGLQVSNIFIKNHKLKKAFTDEINRTGYSQLNTMGILACETAYTYGEKWLSELKEYIFNNICYIKEYILKNIKTIDVIETEGTYLVWLDFRKLNLTEDEREDLLLNKAGLWLDSGAMFGADGLGFERINAACSRKTLEMALKKLEKAVNDL